MARSPPARLSHRALENPFSFYERDLARLREKDQLAQAAKDPARWRREFHANPIPASTYEDRYRQLLAEEELRPLRIKERAASLLASSAMPPRMQVGVEAAEARRSQSAGQRPQSASRAEMSRPYNTRQVR